MWLLTLALQVNIKFTEDKHLTSSLIRLECPVTETQGQPVLGEMKETERREPLEARTQLEAFTGVPGAWPTSRSGSDKPLDYPFPGESPHVLCESPLRTEDISPPTSWSPLKAENVGTRKGPNPSRFPPTCHRIQTWKRHPTSLTEFTFLKSHWSIGKLNDNSVWVICHWRLEAHSSKPP